MHQNTKMHINETGAGNNDGKIVVALMQGWIYWFKNNYFIFDKSNKFNVGSTLPLQPDL